MTLSSPNLPRDAFPESVIVDNNAFTFYRRGSFPQLDQWVARIARVAHRASSFSAEVVVVLPDCPLDPLRTLLSCYFLLNFVSIDVADITVTIYELKLAIFF